MLGNINYKRYFHFKKFENLDIQVSSAGIINEMKDFLLLVVEKMLDYGGLHGGFHIFCLIEVRSADSPFGGRHS